MRTLTIALLAAVLAGAAASDADESAKPAADAAAAKPGACYFIRDIGSWKPSPDAKSIFLRVDRRQVIKLELADKCPSLTWPSAHLINHWHGTSFCDALDWQLSVSQGPGPAFEMPCIVKKMVPLTPEEVQALPPKQRP